MKMNESLFGRYSSSCDISKHISGLKKEPTEQSSVENLQAISGSKICQRVLRKFRYLQRKMEMENARRAKSKAISKKERAIENSGKNHMENVDTVEKIGTEKKLNDADPGALKSSIQYKKPAHKKTNTMEIETNKQTDKELQRKAQVQLEQSRLYDKLLEAVESAETSLCDSDCETENKLFEKRNDFDLHHGTKKSDKKGVRNVPNNIDVKAFEVSQMSVVVKDSPRGVKRSIDVNRNPKGKRKLDWSEQLLFLEMSHSVFDEQTNIDEIGTSMTTEEEDKSERNSAMEQNDLSVAAKEVNIPKTVLKGRGVNTKKRRKRATKNENTKFEEEILHNQIKNIRETRLNKNRSNESADTQLTDTEDRLKVKESCDSVIDCSVANHTKNTLTNANSCKDLRLSLDTATPFSASTPCPKSRAKNRYSKKKTCKRKVDNSQASNGFDENAIEPLTAELHDVSSEASMLDLSLPTPRPPRTNLDPLSFTCEDMDDECSSDEDLPIGLTPLKIEKTFSENDIVWIKWKKWPHLPAVVKKLYKKKRRFTCAVFLPNGLEEDFTMGYGNSASVIPYCDPKKDEILEHIGYLVPGIERVKGLKVNSMDPDETERMHRLIWIHVGRTRHKFVFAKQGSLIIAEAENLSKDDLAFFRGSCAHAENFLTKKALKGLEGTGVLEEKVHLEDQDESRNNNEEKIPVCQKKRKRTESSTDSDCTITKVEQKADSLSKQGQKRIERMSQKTKPLTDFLVSDITKEYLQNIYLGSIQSDLHERFLSGTVRERDKMKHRGFGPIDDEDQIELLLNTYLNWLKTINKINIHEINYVFDVWVPEAVVFALKKVKGYNRKRAWEQFNKGVRRTKEELRIIHQDMIDVETNRKQISDKPINFVLT